LLEKYLEKKWNEYSYIRKRMNKEIHDVIHRTLSDELNDLGTVTVRIDEPGTFFNVCIKNDGRWILLYVYTSLGKFKISKTRYEGFNKKERHIIRTRVINTLSRIEVDYE